MIAGKMAHYCARAKNAEDSDHPVRMRRQINVSHFLPYNLQILGIWKLANGFFSFVQMRRPIQYLEYAENLKSTFT